MTKTFLDSLVSEHQYMVLPIGHTVALKQCGITSPAAVFVAQALFSQAYRRHRQYHGKTSGIACRTSLTQLQQLTALSRSSVQAGLDKLESAGLIRRGDTDRRGTLFDLSKMAEAFMQHATRQSHIRTKNLESPQVPAGTPTEKTSPATPVVANPDPDPALNETLTTRLKAIEKQIKQLKEQLTAGQSTDPADMIRQLRMSLKHGKPMTDEKTLLLSKQISILEQERKQIQMEIDRIRKALASSERTPAHKLKEKDRLPRQVASKPKRPARNHLKWMIRRLKQMRVSNPMETACEVLWALENGWYATSPVTQAWKPFQALASALKLIEQGRWRSPSGCESWRYQQRVAMAIGMKV